MPVILTLLATVLLAVGLYLNRLVQVDDCFDRGGSFDDTRAICVF